MEATAIIMGLIGFFLIYGGLACCIGIAWRHSRDSEKDNAEKTDIPADTGY